jgi:hypothetical protein
MFKSLYSLQLALLAEKTCQLINHPQKDYPIWAKKTHNAHYDASEIKNTNLQLKYNHHPKHKNIHSSTATCWEVHIKSILCHRSIFNHVHCTPHLFEFQGNPILLPHLGIQDIDCSRNRRGSQKKVKTSKFQLVPDCSNYHSSWSAFAHLQKNLEEKTIVSKQCSVGKKKKKERVVSHPRIPSLEQAIKSHKTWCDWHWSESIPKHSDGINECNCSRTQSDCQFCMSLWNPPCTPARQIDILEENITNIHKLKYCPQMN